MTDTAHRLHLAGRLLGYTLIETVVVIVVVGVLAAGASVFIVRAVQGYTDLGRRAALVEAAESALRRMARDIHSALPNSVRVTDPGTGASFALELVPMLDAAKYNTQLGASCAKLTVGNNNTDFDILGCFRNPVITQYVGGGPTTAFRIVVNNADTSVYTHTGITSPITPLGTTINVFVDDGSSCTAIGGACGTATNRHHITLGTAHKFGAASPNQRLYVVATPVSYLCDTSAGTLTRYYNYPIQSSQPISTGTFAASFSSALVTHRVSNCRVLTATTDVKNRGLVTLTLGLSESGESIRLVHQVQLDNSR